MTIRRAKPLPDLYDDVHDYDLVVVPDAPLASALDRQLDRPHLGRFAETPRQLVPDRHEGAEERTVFLELLAETDLSWKQAATLGEEIIHCWESTGQPDAILEYDRYDDEATRTAVEHVRDLDITSKHLADHHIDGGRSVAVVGEERLTTLERSVLPDDYDSVDRFGAGTFDPPPFRIFDSAAAMVDALVDAIPADAADDVAVVLDAGSEYSSLVESALEVADVPYYGGPRFVDDPHHRAFVRLLRAAFGGPDVRVADVRPICTAMDVAVDVEHHDKRLHALDSPQLDWLADYCTGIADGGATFVEVLADFEAAAGVDLGRFAEELETLGLVDRTVTETAVDRLEFYLQSYDVPIDRDNEGVLLADATAATHVDRPLVFSLGLDDGWTRTPPRRPWVDRDRAFARQVEQFQLLIQSGADQQYLVRDSAGGSPVTPCLYFEELFDAEYERFGDLPSERYRAGGAVGGAGGGRDADATDATAGFDHHPLDVEPTSTATISQSSLATYVNSPRDYFFDRLVDAPDRDYFRAGNAFHDFAEFYAHHPEVIQEAGLDAVVDILVAEMEPFVRDVDRAVARTRYRAGVENLVAFLKEHGPEVVAFDGRADADAGADPDGEADLDGNVFAAHFDRPVGSDVTERWFENEPLGVKGKIDLVQSPARLVDYKSGRKKSSRSVVTNSALDELADTPDFQALLYLAHQRTEHPSERLTFVFVHFLDNVADAVAGNGDLADTLTTVTYYPTAFADHAASEETFEHLRENGAGDCRKTLSKVTYGDYRAAFDKHEFPDVRDSDELIESAWGRRFIEDMRNEVGDYKYVTSGCEQAMRELMRVRNRNYFADDVDAFEAFVSERLAEVNARRAGEERFPIEGPGGEPNYRRVSHRDLLLEGGGRDA